MTGEDCSNGTAYERLLAHPAPAHYIPYNRAASAQDIAY